MAMNEGSEVTFEIIEEIGIISTQGTGWTKEINLVSWNGGVAKYDIREWDPSHARMSRGITLKEDEMRRILDLMKRRRSRARNRVRNVPDDVARDIAVEAQPSADAADIAGESEN
ncbi:MAG: YdbC family protein [Lentihominibacter sp.]